MKKITLKQSEKDLQTIFTSWYSDAPKVKGEIVTAISYQARNQEKDVMSEWGRFETLGTAFENKKVIIKELPEMVGKEVWEVGEYITQKGWTPVGHEYMQWLYEHQDAQEKPKNWQWWYCFGSLFRHSNGKWDVPYVSGVSAGLRRSGYWLGGDWDEVCRVVLLGTTAELDTDPLAPDVALESSLASLESRGEKTEFNKGYLQGIDDAIQALNNLKNI